MTEPLIPDELLESILRARAGTGAPPDLREAILGSVAADGPRPAAGRRPWTPWRLLAVAAISLVVIGSAAAVGSGLGPFGREPSLVAVAPSPGVLPSDETTPAPTAIASTVASQASPSATVQPSRSPSAGAGAEALAYLQLPADPLAGGPGTLYLANHDGTDPHLVATAVDGLAGWSASGKYLAIYRSDQDQGTWTITIVTPDGTVVGTIPSVDMTNVLWAPTEDVLLVAGRVHDKAPLPHASARLYRPNGRSVRTLQTPHGVSEFNDGMAWSPDGQEIVAAGCVGCAGTKYDDTPAQTEDLWILMADGSAPRRLTASPSSFEVSPTWSPDGSMISYWVGCGVSVVGCPSGTYLQQPDGSHLRQLMTEQSAVIWTADSSRLLYTVSQDLGGGAFSGNVHVIGVDGENDELLTDLPGDNGPLALSDDGRDVLFIHIPYDPNDPTASLPRETWIVGIDGQGARKLGTEWGGWAWRPAP